MKKQIIKLIDFYQNEISPHKNCKCRYIPSCSQYAKDAFENYNVLYATFLSTKRLLKCNPLFKSKFDPIPKYRKALEQEAKLEKEYYERLKKHKKLIIRKSKNR